MKLKVIKRFLDSIKEQYTSAGTDYLKIDILSSINLNSDANQMLSRYNCRVKFDFTNNLIYIKKYKYKNISGELHVLNRNNNDITIDTLYTRRAPSAELNKNIDVNRDCYLYLVDSKGAIIDNKFYKITNIKREGFNSTITTEEPVPQGGKLFYTTSEYPDAVLDNYYQGYLIKYTPETDNLADIFIDASVVAGFTLNTYY